MNMGQPWMRAKDVEFAELEMRLARSKKKIAMLCGKWVDWISGISPPSPALQHEQPISSDGHAPNDARDPAQGAYLGKRIL
jgi:hypothetical protein